MNQTQEQIDYEKALQELNDLKKDAEKLNNPDDFAKYGKLRRVLAKKEKELEKLKVKADQSIVGLLSPKVLSPSKSSEAGSKKTENESELMFEEAKNVKEDPPLVPDATMPKIDLLNLQP